jgi:hypothetical protein
MSEAQKMFDDAFAIARAFTESPEAKAYYKKLARKRSAEMKREATVAKAAREAQEAEDQRKRSYDVWALNGGSDECTQFGINDGCQPHCPVFMRGDCEMQGENEKLFAGIG